MSIKTYIRHHNVMKAKGLGGGGRKLNWTHHQEMWWSFFTEPGYLQFSLKDSLCVCKSVIYHSSVALFHSSVLLGKRGNCFLYFMSWKQKQTTAHVISFRTVTPVIGLDSWVWGFGFSPTSSGVCQETVFTTTQRTCCCQGRGGQKHPRR